MEKGGKGMSVKNRSVPGLRLLVFGAAILGSAVLSSCAFDSPVPTASASAGPTPAGPRGPVSIATFTGTTAAITSSFRVDAGSWTVQYATTAKDCAGAAALILVFDASHPSAFVRNIPVNGCVVSGTATVPFGPSDFYLKLSVSSPQVSYTVSVSEVR